MMMPRLLCFAIACFAAWPACAELKLPAIFGDNMVVQAGAPVHVWGQAEPHDEIQIALSTSHGEADWTSVTADEDGKWTAKLPAVELQKGPAESDWSLAVKCEHDSKSFKNILIGDVWLCSGQSNMEWPVARANNPEQEIAAADYPKLRLFTVEKNTSGEPLDDVKGSWVECSPETVAQFSAVGYFFGRQLHQDLGRPIGLIDSTWGGTPSEAWTSPEAVAGEPAFGSVVRYWDQLAAKYEKQRAAGEEPKPLRNQSRPSHLYNAMIHPLIPFSIKGAIWYQGEANAKRAYNYRTIFPTMIADWREQWDQGDFPFLFVQLANFMKRKDAPGDSAWAELREAQTMTLDKLPNTGMATIIDIGEADDIHPRNKQDVGKRLALAAKKIAYGQDVVHSGPTYRSFKADGERAEVTFENAGSGLEAKGQKLVGFEVAQGDGPFVFAEAEVLDSETVVVEAPENSGVEQIDAIRYAWADNPAATLYNREGLPAVPFRTDDRKGVTEGK